jgi:hypothetical protein
MAEGGVGGASHPRRDRARKSALVLARDGSELVPKNRQGCARDVVDVGSVVRPERQLILLVSKAGSRPFVSFDSEVVWREPSDDVDGRSADRPPRTKVGTARSVSRRTSACERPRQRAFHAARGFRRSPTRTSDRGSAPEGRRYIPPDTRRPEARPVATASCRQRRRSDERRRGMGRWKRLSPARNTPDHSRTPGEIASNAG